MRLLGTMARLPADASAAIAQVHVVRRKGKVSTLLDRRLRWWRDNSTAAHGDGRLESLHRKRDSDGKQKCRDGNDGFADRPGFERLSYAHVEVLLYKPESAIVDMRENKRARPRHDCKQFRMNPAAVQRDWRHDTRGSSHCHRGRACRETHECRQ